MPRRIRNIDIYLPLNYNNGRPIEESKFIHLQGELLARFGGLTSVQRKFPLQGLWQSGAKVFRDRVVVFTVMDFQTESELETVRYLERLKVRLKRKFAQLEILITLQELLAI